MALFRWRRASKPQFDAALAPKRPVAVVGDIHGRIDLLEALLGQITAQAPAEATLVFVGDYIDRGDDSAEVLRRVQGLQAAAPEDVICLMGNHEKMLLEFLDAPERWGPRWMRHGGLQTLASFRVGLGPDVGLGRAAPEGAERDWPAIRDALRRALGPELEAWLRALPLSWQSGNLFVAHAGADPAQPIDDQDPDGLVWGGPGFYDTPRGDGIWVAHGHVIRDAAEAAGGRIALDTGAYATGRLTAALATPEDLRFLQT